MNIGVFVSSDVLYGGIGGHERQSRRIKDAIHSGPLGCQMASEGSKGFHSGGRSTVALLGMKLSKMKLYKHTLLLAMNLNHSPQLLLWSKSSIELDTGDVSPSAAVDSYQPIACSLSSVLARYLCLINE